MNFTVFWATWAIGLMLHMLVYHRKAGNVNNLLITLIQGVAAAIVANLGEYSVIWGIAVIQSANAITSLASKQLETNRRIKRTGQWVIQSKKMAGMSGD